VDYSIGINAIDPIEYGLAGDLLDLSFPNDQKLV